MIMIMRTHHLEVVVLRTYKDARNETFSPGLQLPGLGSASTGGWSKGFTGITTFSMERNLPLQTLLPSSALNS
jgi:hypothetical protein